jgi:hypothetical protein
MAIQVWRDNLDGDHMSQRVEDCGFGCRAQVVFWVLIVAARQSAWKGLSPLIRRHMI